MDNKEFIARRAAQELHNGDVVNLGIGLPTMVANYVPENIEVFLQSENGLIGASVAAEPGKEDPYITNAGGGYITVIPGASFFDSTDSFGIIRGGHVDVTILGALQVDQFGNLANWMVPNKKVPGMGGAMDLVVGAKKVIIAMEHTAKGNHKILEECSFPLTAVKVVDLIITEMGVMKVTEKGLELSEIAPDISIEEVQNATGCKLIISPNLKVIDIA
jgi:acetate CoA/acetoacetate CoA-transferase beta subunit